MIGPGRSYIVITYGWGLRDSKRHHTKPNDQPSPGMRAWMGGGKAECPEPGSGKKQAGEGGRQTSFRFSEAVHLVGGAPAKQTISDKVRRQDGEDGTNYSAKVDQADVAAPKVRRDGQELRRHGCHRHNAADHARAVQHHHPDAVESECQPWGYELSANTAAVDADSH